MSESKYSRTKKKQLGQFMTPITLSKKLIESRKYEVSDKILEPSFGEGSFIISIVEKLISVYDNSLTKQEKINKIFANNIYGVELDRELFNTAIKNIEDYFGCKIINHNLINDDFFNVTFSNISFNYVEGNPPFGGTFETSFGEILDKIYGFRDGEKIKKETYSFFTIKCLELLKENGKLGFVCSDTFLSINTMKGLRKYVLKHTISIKKITHFSDETNYGMVYFDVQKNNKSNLKIDGKKIDTSIVESTPNYSFLIDAHYEKYFNGPKLKNFITCSSGMTTGKNKLFLKEVVNNRLIEPYQYNIVVEPKTLDKEIKRTKLNRISEGKKEEIENGTTEEILIIENLNKPIIVDLPNEDYLPYNKSSSEEIYSEPKTYIYWRNNGQAVITFKKTGPWYLHGVGGQKFFGLEGLTWGLIADRIKVRYLPEGYILDSGAPVGVLNKGVDKDELFFIIGWMLSPLSSEILKKVLNHTKNIQSKDIERLPYPFWVTEKNKKNIIHFVKDLIKSKIDNKNVNKDYKSVLEQYFVYPVSL